MTLRKTAQFTVAPERLDEALAAIRRFVAHTETEPGTGLLVVAVRRTSAELTHRSSDAVMTFTEALYPLYAEPPSFNDWHPVS